MTVQSTNIAIIAIAAVAPAYLIIRLPRWGWLIGVIAAFLLLVLRDSLIAGTSNGGDEFLIRLFSRFLAGLTYCTPLYCLKALSVLIKNRRKNTPTSKRTKIWLTVAGAAAVLIPPVWWLWIGLIQCYFYHEAIAELPGTSRLSIEPQRIELPANEDSPRFSLGYAELAIAQEEITSVKTAFKANVLMDFPECNLVFIRPFAMLETGAGHLTEDNFNPLPIDLGLWEHDDHSEELSREVLQADPVGRLLLLMREDPFASRLEIENALPKTYKQVFLMKHDEYRRYLILLMSKTIGPACEDILVFETHHIRGFVFLGRSRAGTETFASVFSKGGNVTQGINVRADSQERSRDILLSMLASYRYTIKEVPPEDELHDIITAAIAKHDKFQAPKT